MMAGGSPSLGDKVVVVTNALCRYEGYYHHGDTDAQTFTLNNVRFFGTEHRDTPAAYNASPQVYESIVMKMTDIKQFNTIKSPVLADPAIVSAREQSEEDEPKCEFSSTGPNLTREVENSLDVYQGSTGVRQAPRGRIFVDGLSGHTEGMVRHSGSQSGSYHCGSLGGYGIQEGNANNFNIGGRAHHQRNDWRSINPRSEGSFPQKHPGMQQQPVDDFNFEKGIQEFTRLRLKNISTDDANIEEWQNEDVAKDKHQRISHHTEGYDKEKSFFDNLSGSTDFDSPRQQQNRFSRMGSSRSGDFQTARSRNPNVETFGEETVKQLYEILVWSQRICITSAAGHFKASKLVGAN
ncbi:protein LSM14 homolog B-B-like isoform X3 [Varroa destructor]|uniref:FFD box profile domain-containing protein n=1 Tax=Varroa destructor TaxID=109461 RepID=A0A7M7J1G8_VARDE|nr:protein LSM14 homolog B-B-like isoform X3 [Varroa destructor]